MVPNTCAKGRMENRRAKGKTDQKAASTCVQRIRRSVLSAKSKSQYGAEKAKNMM